MAERITDKILNLLFPPKCPFCRKILTGKAPVCKECMSALPYTGEKTCSICGIPIEELSHHICPTCRNRRNYFEHTFIPLIYKGPAREAAIALKGAHPFYAKAFAFLMADKILSSPRYVKPDIITFVPQNSASKRLKGYNHAELIARELAKLLSAECKALLVRTNDGLPQHTLTSLQRRENVKKCYFSKNIRGSGTVFLVDDVYTTGATANYCSKLLLQMGFERVYPVIATIRCDDMEGSYEKKDT